MIVPGAVAQQRKRHCSERHQAAQLTQGKRLPSSRLTSIRNYRLCVRVPHRIHCSLARVIALAPKMMANPQAHYHNELVFTSRSNDETPSGIVDFSLVSLPRVRTLGFAIEPPSG